MKIHLLALALLALLHASCTSTELRPVELIGTSWRLDTRQVWTGVNEKPLVLRFGDESVSGFGGCNSFHASMEIEGDGIAIGPIAATRMAGSPEAMEREQRFFERLQAARRIARDGKRLVLSDEDGGEPMRFVRVRGV